MFKGPLAVFLVPLLWAGVSLQRHGGEPGVTLFLALSVRAELPRVASQGLGAMNYLYCDFYFNFYFLMLSANTSTDGSRVFLASTVYLWLLCPPLSLL